MCHCAPVLSITIQLRKHIGSGSACVQDVHRGCALPGNDSGYAPTARLSAESSDIYSRSTPLSNFEIGSKHRGVTGICRKVRCFIRICLEIEELWWILHVMDVFECAVTDCKSAGGGAQPMILD